MVGQGCQNSKNLHAETFLVIVLFQTAKMLVLCLSDTKKLRFFLISTTVWFCHVCWEGKKKKVLIVECKKLGIFLYRNKNKNFAALWRKMQKCFSSQQKKQNFWGQTHIKIGGLDMQSQMFCECELHFFGLFYMNAKIFPFPLWSTFFLFWHFWLTIVICVGTSWLEYGRNWCGSLYSSLAKIFGRVAFSCCAVNLLESPLQYKVHNHQSPNQNILQHGPSTLTKHSHSQYNPSYEQDTPERNSGKREHSIVYCQLHNQPLQVNWLQWRPSKDWTSSQDGYWSRPARFDPTHYQGCRAPSPPACWNPWQI